MVKKKKKNYIPACDSDDKLIEIEKSFGFSDFFTVLRVILSGSHTTLI